MINTTGFKPPFVPWGKKLRTAVEVGVGRAGPSLKLTPEGYKDLGLLLKDANIGKLSPQAVVSRFNSLVKKYKLPVSKELLETQGDVIQKALKAIRPQDVKLLMAGPEPSPLALRGTSSLAPKGSPSWTSKGKVVNIPNLETQGGPLAERLGGSLVKRSESIFSGVKGKVAKAVKAGGEAAGASEEARGFWKMLKDFSKGEKAKFALGALSMAMVYFELHKAINLAAPPEGEKRLRELAGSMAMLQSGMPINFATQGVNPGTVNQVAQGEFMGNLNKVLGQQLAGQMAAMYNTQSPGSIAPVPVSPPPSNLAPSEQMIGGGGAISPDAEQQALLALLQKG